MLRVKAAKPLDRYRVRLTLSDGTVVERDLEAALWGPVFEPLRRDMARFRRMRVRGGTLTWPGRLDVDPDVLIWGGPPPVEDSPPPATLKLPPAV